MIKYIPPQFDSLEDYQKDLKSMAITIWIAFFFCLAAAAGFGYYGWKIAPWVIAAFALFQNLPLAIMYTMRYRWAMERSDETDHTEEE